MKSIKKLFKTPVALGALAAVTLAFAGCNNAIEGTQLNYGEKEQEVIGTTGAKQTPKSASITIATLAGNYYFAKTKKIWLTVFHKCMYKWYLP